MRGFALFGVFMVHFVTSMFFLHPVDEEILVAWSEDAVQYSFILLSDLLFLDKAITLFSVLFGIGFWIQMERLEARGGAFEQIYLKRLSILLAFGLINKFLLFPGDILVEYALFGFLLFFLRRVSARTMLISGLIMMICMGPLAYSLLDPPWIDGDAHDQMQAAAMLSDSYAGWVTQLGYLHIQDKVLALGWVSLGLFVVSRFLIGAWVSRSRLIERARTSRPLVLKMALASVVLGLLCEAFALAIWEEVWQLPQGLADAVRAVSVPTIAFSYACLIILMYGTSRLRWLTSIFVPVGRMALTVYIGHGILILIFGHPFGLYIRPEISPMLSWGVAIGVFLGFSMFCSIWLRFFRFGPLEWLWRSLTYGRAQPFLKQKQA